MTDTPTSKSPAGKPASGDTSSDAVMPIEHVRVEIDRVDNALLGLIAERLELAAAVRRAKSGARVWRPSREDSHVRDLTKRTSDASAALVSKIWAELMSASLALQGPMRLHIALEGDALDVWTLVHDRFGRSIPARSYPTASAALANAYAEDEGVAVLPAPGGMNNWWTALCVGGAMPDMHILAGLPRVSAGGGLSWPRAVAVATADIGPSGADDMLIALQNPKALDALSLTRTLRAEAGAYKLYTVDGYVDDIAPVSAVDPSAKIIGCLPKPLSEI